MSLQSVNPANGEVIRTWPEMSDADLARTIEDVGRGAVRWARTPLRERLAVVAALAPELRSRADALARLMAEEMGKPLAQGRSEVEKCAWACEWYAEHGERLLAPETVDAGGRALVVFRPLGTVLAVMPWNFPLWQVFRFVAPALVAGNTGLLKHAANVQGCAEAIADIVRQAGAPADVFANLAISSGRVAGVIRRPEVRAVTLTGSTPAGRAVGREAGGCLKKVVLELGGSDPYVVLADADVDLAARTCVASRLINTGQSCIAAKRFIVVEEVAGPFTERVVELMRSKTFGDPIARPEVDLGPLARRDLRDEIHDQVERSVKAGAKLLVGGEVPEGPGAFYPATVLTDVRPGVPVYLEETFGPVASILPVKDEEAAFTAANDSPFGLGAALFTRDVERGERLAAERLDAGCCAVNDMVKSDPRLPFGGIKESGHGRELSSYGLREFVNVKSVTVKSAG